MNYVLGFNIGNTNTTMGIYKKDSTAPEKTYTYKTDKKITSDELGIQIKNFVNIISDSNDAKNKIIGITFSSVVTEVNKSYKTMSEDFFGLQSLEICCDIKLGITLKYDNPKELGADRIANAEAAYREYKTDCIIIDLGTANTFCVLHANGTFDGGLIGPGIGITIEALADKTSKLSRVSFEKPDKMIATSTIEAIKSGFFYGYILMINGIIKEIENIYKKEFLTILTGGFSNTVSNYIDKKHIFDPILTLKGIKYLYDLNKNQ